MLDTLVKATILLALVACVAHLLRRRSAAVRHLLWALAIAGLIALPVLTTVVPFRLPVLPSLASPTRNSQRDVDTKSAIDGGRLASRAREAESTSETPPVERSPSVASVDGATIVGTGPQMDLRGALILAWLAVAAILLTRFIVGVLTVNRIANRAVVIADESWHAVADRAGRALGLSVPVDLRRSDDVAMPFACGVLKPVIVLPSASSEWSAERLTAVLMHELAHISRGDLAMNVLSHVVRAVYWFHPLAWLAAYRLRVEGERSCDDAVLRAGALPSEYADHLLSIVRTAGDTVPTVALAMARRSDFEGRLLAILEPGVPRGTLTRSRVAGIAALFFALVTPLAAMTPAAAAAITTPTHSQSNAQAPAPSQGTEQSAAAIAALMETLRDENATVRLAAVNSLGSLGDPRAIAALAKALREDRDARVREAAARALGEIDDKRAVPALLEALKTERVPNVREHIVSALSEIGDSSAVTGISAVIKDPSAAVRRAAVSALGELGDPSVVPALLTVVRDDDVEVRRNVADVLGKLENPSAIDALIGLARDADPEVRTNALESLAHFEDERALPAFLAALKDAKAEVRQHAADGIGDLHDKLKAAPRPLIDALNDPNAEVRHTAAHAVGNIGDEAAVPALKKLTSDSNTEVRQAAAEALSEIGGAEAMTALMGLLKDSDPEIRKIAAEALGKRRR